MFDIAFVYNEFQMRSFLLISKIEVIRKVQHPGFYDFAADGVVYGVRYGI